MTTIGVVSSLSLLFPDHVGPNEWARPMWMATDALGVAQPERLRVELGLREEVVLDGVAQRPTLQKEVVAQRPRP